MTGSRLARLAFAFPLFVLLAATAPSAHAAVLRTRVTVEPPVVLVDEPVMVTVSVETPGFNEAKIETPTVAGIHIEPVGRSQNVVMAAGNVMRTDVFIYRATAVTAGKQKIPSFKVIYDGDVTETGPALWETSSSLPNAGKGPTDEGGAASQLFSRLVVDRRRVWWNEQIVARVQVYARAPLEDMPTWEPPDAPGFWAEPLGDPRHGRVSVDGRPYELYERVIAFFPTRAGHLRLGPARSRVRVLQRPDPAYDPMAGFFPGAPAEVVELPVEAAPVDITVDALPGGAPSGFRGAVGRLELGVRVDRAKARAGEPVTVSTSIRGEGNLSSATDPTIVAIPSAASYPAGARTDLDQTGDRVRGVRRRDVAFVPDHAGTMLVLPIEFTWFDPEAGTYRVQRSDTIRVHVDPPAGGTMTETAATAIGVPAVPRPTGARGVTGSMDGWPTGWPLAAGFVSLAGYFGMAVAVTSRRRAARDPQWRRARLAEAAARRVAAAARGADHARAAESTEAALRDAAGVRFDIDPEGRSRRDLVARLRAADVPEPAIEELVGVLGRLERGAFAPGGTAEVAAALRDAVALAERWRSA